MYRSNTRWTVCTWQPQFPIEGQPQISPVDKNLNSDPSVNSSIGSSKQPPAQQFSEKSTRLLRILLKEKLILLKEIIHQPEVMPCEQLKKQMPVEVVQKAESASQSIESTDSQLKRKAEIAAETSRLKNKQWIALSSLPPPCPEEWKTYLKKDPAD